VVAAALGSDAAGAEELPLDRLTELSIEQLLDVQVMSVSRRAQRLADSAAAVFVITAEDLRRSGVTSIPDALRMVPGLHVARVDSNKWAVGSRGLGGRFATNLLVLMDGRSVYTPSFSGVYWEVQDTLIEDIARIEVIRGPGATLWGANAVNGVINIITRRAQETGGGLVSLGAGTEERGYVNLRYGGDWGQGTYGRVYARFFRRDGVELPDGTDVRDDWDMPGGPPGGAAGAGHGGSGDRGQQHGGTHLRR
jgi:iron complex outermembrane receptor protein